MHTQLKITILTGAIMSLALSLLLSGFFTWLQLGFTSIWLKAWALGFAFGWPLAFGLATLIGKPARGLAVRLVTGVTA